MTDNRTCGKCSLCCLLLDVPEAGKPKDGWCPHCRPGKGGCIIYDRRPDVCRSYRCVWLTGALEEYWAPINSKLLLDLHRNEETGQSFLNVHVHPNYPNRWREEPYYDDLKMLSYAGLMGTAETRYQTIILSARKRSHIILPHGAVPFTRGATLRVGDDRWEHVTIKDDAALKRLEVMFEEQRR